MLRNGFRIACVALALALTAAPASAAPLSSAQLRAALASSSRLDEPAVAMLFDRHFRESCLDPDGLPFDLVCNYVPPEHEDDPSPWPDVLLGVQGGRIVALLQVNVGWAPASWTCSPLPGLDGASFCTPPDIVRRTHRDWARRWSEVLRAAG